jgi:hypothetical protein
LSFQLVLDNFKVNAMGLNHLFAETPTVHLLCQTTTSNNDILLFFSDIPSNKRDCCLVLQSGEVASEGPGLRSSSQARSSESDVCTPCLVNRIHVHSFCLVATLTCKRSIYETLTP